LQYAVRPPLTHSPNPLQSRPETEPGGREAGLTFLTFFVRAV
jgi:hypothetical protein